VLEERLLRNGPLAWWGWVRPTPPVFIVLELQRFSCSRSSPDCFPDGYPDVQSVAQMVRVSARTLQRRLSDESLTFAGVVARARFDVGQLMLDDPAHKVVDVALDLGYSDHAHFTPAFVRWAGIAPREFRRVRSIGSGGLKINVEPRKVTASEENLLRGRKPAGQQRKRREESCYIASFWEEVCHSLGDVEPREVAGRLPLSAQPAMRRWQGKACVPLASPWLR
jgi:AraC-like DNA-binding protein